LRADLATVEEALTDPRYVAFDDELRASRAELTAKLNQLTATTEAA